MRKRFLCMLAVLLLSMAACRTEADAPERQTQTGDPESTAPTTQPEPTSSAAEPTTEAETFSDSSEATEPTTLAVWDESDWQNGPPLTPQPGDTTATWNPSAARQYPADEDCSPEELLEKWMAVEGLTAEDLEARNCEQLILVVARETDGVETYTTCYQKQEDGSWAPVERLTRMQGWTGSNGIMHDRRRNTNTSPAGLWSIGAAFGNAEMPQGIKLPWRQVTPNSDWVCDADSAYFNTWQERGDPALEDWSDDVEHLEDYSAAYAYACVIRFNTPPYMIPDRGCAIFFHCSKGPTGGCIGLPEQDVIETLLWLDPSRSPYILITGCQADAP